MFDDFEQAGAALIGFGQGPSLYGASERCQRVFEFMGNIRGETFNRFDPIIKRAGHIP